MHTAACNIQSSPCPSYFIYYRGADTVVIQQYTKFHELQWEVRQDMIKTKLHFLCFETTCYFYSTELNFFSFLVIPISSERSHQYLSNGIYFVVYKNMYGSVIHVGKLSILTYISHASSYNVEYSFSDKHNLLINLPSNFTVMQYLNTYSSSPTQKLIAFLDLTRSAVESLMSCILH